MSSSWQAEKERSTPLTLQTIRWIALNLGRPVARVLLYPISAYFLLFAPRQRQASLNYLNRVLGRKATYLDVAKHIHCFAATILDRIYLITAQFEKLAIQFPSENMPLKYSQNGKGCLLLGSHVGSFEVLRSYAVKKCPLPIKILMYEGQTPMIIKMFNALNPKVAETMLTLDDSPASLLQVKEAIDSGHAVGLLGDRVMREGVEKTVRCQLLGSEIELPAAPILIAAALKVPLIAFFGIYHGGNRYQIHFDMLGEEVVLNRKTRQQDMQRYAQQYADILEKHILSAPYNWFNFYDYWQDEQ
ncbi:MAG: lipid A biosynthesis acyltransferase [Methylococcaceae bacterium]|nr:lipid A biosynthesis acyltransferase [Methylococcaceae bacterium]